MWSVCLALALGACGNDDPPPTGPSEPDTVVDSIWVDPPERNIGVLGIATVSVGAAALNEGGDVLYGSTLDPGRFAWSSSAPDIATVDAVPHPHIEGREGRLVTGLSEGTATITATSQGVTGSMTVTVRDRAGLGWSVPIPEGISAGNVMGPDGTIYIGTNDHGADRSLWYAISPQGEVLWTMVLPLTGRSHPAIADDGTLYFGSRSTGAGDFAGRLIAVDPGGTVRWILEDIEGIRSSPAIGSDGTIYVAGGHHVHAVDPQGKIQWTYETTDNAFFLSSPAIGSHGTIYVGGEDERLHAINPDGSLQWTFRTGDRIRSSPSIGTDGTVYFGSHDGRLYAIDPHGNERWSVNLDERGIRSSPSIAPDGTIYVMAEGVTAIDPGGSVRWSYPIASRSGATPILGADGTIYLANITSLGGIAGIIFALDSQGRLLWEYPTEGAAGGSPVIGLDGAVVAAAEHELVAVVETDLTNGGYQGAPWPVARGDRANTGRAGG